MEHQLSEQHGALRDSVREFSRSVVAPGADARDHEATFPYELIAELAGRRWMGIPFGAEHGGLGADTLAFVLAIEELASADSALAATVSAHTWQGTMPIHLWGSEEQKSRWLPWLCSGQRLAAFGSSPGARPTRTDGVLTDGSWTLDGAEHAVANAGTRLSACLTATVVTDKGKGRPELSSVIVPTNASGYGIGSPSRSVGWRSVDLRPVTFKECKVEEPCLLGPRGDGLTQYLHLIDGNRIGLAGISVGVAQGAFDEAQAELDRRASVPGAIAPVALQDAVSALAPQIEEARRLTWRAALERDEGKSFALTAAQARLEAGRLALAATELSMQARGGFGQIEAGAAWRVFRDARMLAVSDGSLELQQMAIAGETGRLTAPSAPEAPATVPAPVAAPPPAPAEAVTELTPQQETVAFQPTTGTLDPSEPIGRHTPAVLATRFRAFLATEGGVAVIGAGLGVLLCLLLLSSWRV